jgi:hypothetical protein
MESNMKRILLALGVLCIVSTTQAQDTTKPTSDTQTPAIATPDTTNPAAPVAGKNSFTEGQAKRVLEDKGYRDVTALTNDDAGVWNATARKDGTTVKLKLDYQGNIVESPH